MTEQSVCVGDGILKTNKHWRQNSQLELQITLYTQVNTRDQTGSLRGHIKTSTHQGLKSQLNFR